MKKRYLILIIVTAVIFAAGSYYYLKKIYLPQKKLSDWEKTTKELVSKDTFKEGDIIFQSTASRQTRAIQLATHSQWSHVGIIFKNNNELFVYEAVQPVRSTPLALWLSKSIDGKFAVKRLVNADSILTSENIIKLKSSAEKFTGKNYDIYFEWSDDKLYCSEYVWKIYYNTLNIEIGNLEKLKDFDLKDDEVKKIMNERYGSNIPFNENVISPVSMFNSDKLVQIYPK